MKASEAAELVLMLLAAYPAARTTDATSQVYETMLADLDAAVARRAVTQLIATSRFFPSVAEIREVVAAFVHAERAKRARALEARKPSLTRSQLGERDRQRAPLTLVAPLPAPADLVRRIAAKALPPREPVAPRRWTAAELDAALNGQHPGVV